MTITERVTATECQVERLVSDVESEKGTRLRIHQDFSRQIELLNARLTHHDRLFWMFSGGIVLLNAIVIIVGLYFAGRPNSQLDRLENRIDQIDTRFQRIYDGEFWDGRRPPTSRPGN